MKDQLVSFETATLAKGKGFDEDVHDAYYVSKDELSKVMREECRDGYPVNSEDGKAYTSAPTQSLLQRWLRETHDINVESNYLPNAKAYRSLYVPMTDTIPKEVKYRAWSRYYGNKNWPNYEEALEEGLQEALKLITI